MKAPITPNEAERLQVLRAYDLLDTPSEMALDDLAELAACICKAPIALITLVDEGRQWFKSRVRFDVAESERDISFCAHAILEQDFLIVPDARQDVRFRDNPWVTGEPGIRFYAAAPLRTPDGHALGTLCVIDREPREMHPDHQQALQILSRQVMTQFELRRRAREIEALKQAHDQMAATRRQEVSNAERIQRDRTRLADAELTGRRLLETAEQSRRALLSILEDQKQIEETLRESETRFRLLFEHNPAPMLVYERASLKLLAVNEAFQRQYDYSREEALALLLPDLYPVSEKEAIMALIPHLQGHAYVGEWHHLRKDGSLVNIVAYSHDIDFEGQKARIAVIHDITERKQMEDALRLNETRYRTLLETAPFPVVISRLRDGVLRYGNRRAETQFGISREEGIGQLARDFYADTVARDRFLERLLRETTIVDQELRLCAADGTPFWAQISAAIIEFEGEPAIFSSINDISTRKQAEDDVRQLNIVLEQRVGERTEQLQALNKELEAFAYSVSHDLKAPLRGIDGYSRLLLDDHAGELNDESRLFLQNIRQGTRQMAQLIEDLLAYSRIERRSLQTDRIDLPSLVKAMLAERAEDIVALQVAITVAINPQLVNADRDGLTMALRNLVDNALKFTRNTPNPAIEIGMRLEPGACILWVRDNGIGFDMKFHKRIFEIFQRLHLADEFPGTGIGLAIVRKALERMGGTAWAESTPGQGATFYLGLPL